MPYLTVKNGDNEIKIKFSGTPVLRDAMALHGVGVFSPCGGKGSCGKCRVDVFGAVSEPNEKEKTLGYRLACQTRLLGDATVTVGDGLEIFGHIETDMQRRRKKNADWENYAAAVDLGTTTVVLKLFGSDGACIAEERGMNPQRAVASDVLGRIDVAVRGSGEMLQRLIADCVRELLLDACEKAGVAVHEVERLVITGNTAMMYLLTNRDPVSIARAPFESETLFGEWVGGNTLLAPCMNAFVGGDITCAVLASGMCERDGISLLCDIGTNGEIALWKNRTLYVTSAAAGPAFEGGEISCGCGNIPGAVDSVYVENGAVIAHTVCNKAASGICGSGIIDAVSAFLSLGMIDKSGYAVRELEIGANGGSVVLTQDDVRALQLAKAAINAAIETLLAHTGTDVSDVERFYIAGGFGNRISLENAARIGLFSESLVKNAVFIANAALSGACDMLFDCERIECGRRIAKEAVHVELGGSEEFYKRFIASIDF